MISVARPRAQARAVIFGIVAGLSAGATTSFAQSDLSAFKLAGEPSFCTVPRLATDGDTPQTVVGAGGGSHITDDEAVEAYDCIKERLSGTFAKAGHAPATGYTDWSVYSSAPYVSATHGNRYVNNYANSTARDYGRFEDVGKLPVGSVLAKDSFVVNDQGQILIGALTLMEKMEARFNPSVGDWRFTMILPDGTMFGDTGGASAQNVGFCGSCHGAAGPGQDYLFLVPERYRISR